MEKVVKKFVSRTQVGNTETCYEFKAVIIPSYGSCYRIIVSFVSYKSGKVVSSGKTVLYFDSADEMVKEFEYQYVLCKNNVFTKFIKVEDDEKEGQNESLEK